MSILVVEDNFLVGELIRLAVEEANLNVVGPVATLEEGIKRADAPSLKGALLDINIGGRQSFPLARLLKARGLPIVFISGYGRSVLPSDMQDAPLIGKPILPRELTRLTRANFKVNGDESANNAPVSKRAAGIGQRIADAERRLATQKRRVEKLQVEGYDPQALQLAYDLFVQMTVALETMRRVERALQRSGAVSGTLVLPPISDAMIDMRDPKSLEYWASEFRITPDRLLGLVEEVGSSSRLIAKALEQATMLGPSRRSTALD